MKEVERGGKKQREREREREREERLPVLTLSLFSLSDCVSLAVCLAGSLSLHFPHYVHLSGRAKLAGQREKTWLTVAFKHLADWPPPAGH